MFEGLWHVWCFLSFPYVPTSLSTCEYCFSGSIFIQFYPDSGFRFKVWGLGFLATVCEDLDRDRDIAIVAHVPLY